MLSTFGVYRFDVAVRCASVLSFSASMLPFSALMFVAVAGPKTLELLVTRTTSLLSVMGKDILTSTV